MLHAGRIVPIYRLTASLTARTLRAAIRDALDRFGPYPEYLADLAAEQGLVDIGEAVEQAHYPDGFDRRDRALERLAFDELLALQIGMVSRRRQRAQARSEPLTIDDRADAAIREGVRSSISDRVGHPIELTVDQVRSMDAVRSDIAGAEPMMRLLQGDVGSGKTAVAALALAIAAKAGHQGALLAPTDLLARQHAQTLRRLLDGDRRARSRC